MHGSHKGPLGGVSNGVPISIASISTSCADCSMHELCLPAVVSDKDLDRLESILSKRVRVARGDVLYRSGDVFTSLYAVRLGHFKTVYSEGPSIKQIIGFQMSGEILGMEGISHSRHKCSSIALEDSEVCEIPYARLESLLAELPSLQAHFHRMMSREIDREHRVMLLLGSMSADQRVAAFLLNLSRRYETRGFSANHFVLRMTREDIGNYLGLTIESVSRVFSRFKKNDWIEGSPRDVKLLDRKALEELCTHY
ncbi:MAG: fumarate/nitrate reduction transcriptional regulator Fnr [Burkholderiaceae bacterium]|nr:fumarate/nitrate reduction transcriptional regulator Fnr [Burkholderiaceae bacterium]